MPPGIQLHTDHRLEALAEALARTLGDEALPPLDTETILVPTRGLAQWIELQLAEHHGIAGGLHFPFPGAFLQGLLDRPGNRDAFAPEVLPLLLFRLLGDDAATGLGLARDYCANDRDGRKRFQLATRIARVLDDYQLYRDDLLQRAAAGDTLSDQGTHGPWQAELWRALLRDQGMLAAPPKPPRGGRRGDPTPLLFRDPIPAATPVSPDAAPAHRLAALRTLLADPDRARRVLPKRLSVFGTAALPPAFVELLQRIAAHVPVHLFVPQPTPHYFGDLRARAHAGANPLLARLGTLAREFADGLHALEENATVPCARHEPEPPEPDPDPPSLLACVQRDIAAVYDRAEAGAPRLALRADDDSLRVHDCHSPMRELEVVRDHLLAAFGADETLRPHDVLVLVPDIATYAPYAEAVFGPFQAWLPYRVADRDPASELPLCAAVLAVLGLARDRLMVFDVLRLCEEPAVQRRFALQPGDVPVLAHLCDRAGIRWGIDAAGRARQFGVPPFEENSWQVGIERILLGAAAGPGDDLVLGRLPAAFGTASRDALLARFLTFVRTLFAHLPQLQVEQSPGTWADRVDALLGDLFQPDSADDELAHQRLLRATADLRAHAATARLDEPWSPIVLRDWLTAQLGAAQGGGGFLSGAVTIAALQPMRTVPVRHLFVCGLADQAFPRRDQPAPFDLMARARRSGDRSARLDDQQLFLEALLAARDRLHLTFVGRSQKDDSPCAPSAVVAELLDHIDRTCTLVDPAPNEKHARDRIVVRHPLQPWSRRYRDGSDHRLFTYARDAAPATPREPAPPPAFCDTALPAPTARDVGDERELPFDRLLEFWKHPCRFFLTHALRVRLPRDDDTEQETEPFVVDNLDRWRLQDPIVRAVLSGAASPTAAAPDSALAVARATGMLPVGGLGAFAFDQIAAETASFLRRVGSPLPHRRQALRIQLTDCVLHGEVDGLGDEHLVQARIARLKPKDRMRTWLHHLFLAVARGEGAAVPDRTRYFAKDKTLQIGPIPPAEAAEELDRLVRLMRRGLREPLPFFEKSSYAYASARTKEDQSGAMHKAAKDWNPNTSDRTGPNDSEDAAIRLCMRGRDALALPTFRDLAVAVWTPFLTFGSEA